MFDECDSTGFQSVCKDVGGNTGEGVTACAANIGGCVR